MASDPTISRLIESLGDDAVSAIAAIGGLGPPPGRRSGTTARRFRSPVRWWSTWTPRSSVRTRTKMANPELQTGFGFHPMLAFADHGPGGTGEPLAACCAPGRRARTPPPTTSRPPSRPGTAPRAAPVRVLVRGDTGSGVQGLLWPAQPGLAVLGRFLRPTTCPGRVGGLPRQAWRPALDGDGAPSRGRPGRRADPVDCPPPAGWPPGMRVIARRERPHPGAQLRITDHDGWRITVFATNTRGRPIADLEVRHRLRARAEDRIRGLKDTGLTNLPLQASPRTRSGSSSSNSPPTCSPGPSCSPGTTSPPEPGNPNGLRLRLLAVAGRIITTGRRRLLRLSSRWPWTDLDHRRLHQPLAALT